MQDFAPSRTKPNLGIFRLWDKDRAYQIISFACIYIIEWVRVYQVGGFEKQTDFTPCWHGSAFVTNER